MAVTGPGMSYEAVKFINVAFVIFPTYRMKHVSVMLRVTVTKRIEKENEYNAIDCGLYAISL